MSEQQQIKKPADPSTPHKGTSTEPQSEPTEPHDPAHSTSKTYDELLHGFEEIRKIQTNQEVFEKRGSSHINIEKIKKAADDHETPES